MDESALGGPILDRARERGLHVHGVNFGSRALAEARYRNRRAEIIDKVRQFIQNGGHVRADAMLREEMLAVDRGTTSKAACSLSPRRTSTQGSARGEAPTYSSG